MESKQKKFFTAEDFDKEPHTYNKKSWYKKQWLWVTILVVLLCIIGFVIFSMSDNGDQESVSVKNLPKGENISTPSDTTNFGGSLKDETGNTEPELTNNSNENANEPATLEPTKTVKTTSTASAHTSIMTVNVSNDVEAEAIKVIRGDYGVGQERKDKLGEKYQTIQNRVNELKREGLF